MRFSTPQRRLKMNIQELIVPFIAGLFPSLMAVIPVIIASVKNIKINRNMKDLQLSVADVLQGNKSVESLWDDIKGDVSSIVEQVKDVSVVARQSIQEDVAALTDKAIAKTKEIELTFNNMKHDMEAYYNSMKNQLIEQLKLEVAGLVNDVYKVYEEGQSQVFDK